MNLLLQSIDVPEPTLAEVRRYQTDPEFHMRVKLASSRLRLVIEPLMRRYRRRTQVRDFMAIDIIDQQMFWLAIRLVVEQETPK